MARVTNPICRHKPVGYVEAGDPSGAHASHVVCSPPKCVEDAKLWARALTGLDAEFHVFGRRIEASELSRRSAARRAENAPVQGNLL